MQLAKIQQQSKKYSKCMRMHSLNFEGEKVYIDNKLNRTT